MRAPRSASLAWYSSSCSVSANTWITVSLSIPSSQYSASFYHLKVRFSSDVYGGDRCHDATPFKFTPRAARNRWSLTRPCVPLGASKRRSWATQKFPPDGTRDKRQSEDQNEDAMTTMMLVMMIMMIKIMILMVMMMMIRHALNMSNCY